MTTQTHEFKTEVKQLLDLMIHSLYSHKEVFLRELISNASDALDKARYESLVNSDFQSAGEWTIRIVPDRNAATIAISDNGIGMTRDEVVASLGTIAHSGTREFLKALQDAKAADNPELIGQFGVGFYSSFMVADRVTVLTRRAGAPADEATRWESTADGTFTVDAAVKQTHGTDVILHLKPDEKKYTEEWQIRNIVSRYSDYIEYPVMLEVERQTESTLKEGEKITERTDEKINSGKALWLRDKADISEQEYHEFYRHISHDAAEPAQVIHYRAEGTSEFTALLFLPAKAPFDLYYKDFRIGPSLYVRKVQIMDHCEALIPPYLRFVKGVIDSSDLPLNVSREMLQHNRQTDVIKNSIAKKVLDSLAEMQKGDPEKYGRFHAEFGRVLKEGIHYDFSRKETIADLLLFRSTKAEGGAMRTLADYLADMKPDQQEIYYLVGTNADEALRSPHLESFRTEGYEVLIMPDEVDDLIFGSFEYKEKRFRSITRGDVKLTTRKTDEEEKTFAGLVDYLKKELSADVKDVRVSGRLTDSACCLVSDEGDLDPKMEAMLRAMGQEVPERKRIFEINAGHTVLTAMNDLFKRDPSSPALSDAAAALYDQALILEGSRPKDPAKFAAYLSRLMAETAGRSAAEEQKSS